MPCGDFGILRVRIITKLKLFHGSLHVAFRQAFCTMVLRYLCMTIKMFRKFKIVSYTKGILVSYQPGLYS